MILYDQRKGGMSYPSAQDPRLHFGRGQRSKVDAIVIRWPSGIRQILRDVDAYQILRVKEPLRSDAVLDAVKP